MFRIGSPGDEGEVLVTTGLRGGEGLVLNTTASDEPAVQVLKTTGLSPAGGEPAEFRSSKPRDFGVAKPPSIPHPAMSLLFRSSKPLDFLLPEASLLFRSSKPRDFGVARLSSIPRPAMSLLFRSSKLLDFWLVTRGCHQYHCRRRRSADLVSCAQIVISILVVVVAMKNSARSCCEISA